VQTGHNRCRKSGYGLCSLSENALTRVPAGHMRERERALIRKMIDLLVTRQEGGRVPLHEVKKTPH
jgi:hypothetical protein